MRISENGMVRTVLRDLMVNRNRLSGLYQQLSSGSDVNRPSDDPGGAVGVMQVESTLSEVQQFSGNASLAEDWLRATDSALSEAAEVLNRLRELAVQGSNGTLPEESMVALGEEAQELVEHLVTVGNSQHAGRYIFAGYQTDTKPFELSDDGSVVDFHADPDGSIVYEVGPGVNVRVNVPGIEVFSDLLSTGIELRDALLNADHEAAGDEIAALDEQGDNLLAVRAEIGGRMNRLELSKSRLEDMSMSFKRVISETSEIDFAEVLMNLANVERAYQTSLATGARILPPTLLDYLR